MTEWWTKYQGLVPGAGIFYPEENWISLKSVHGFKLATYRFHHEDPKGLIFIFHGMHCSSGESTHLAQWYYNEGYAVLAFDQESHGKSEGPRGNIISLQDFATDSENYVVKAKSHYDSKIPTFLLGESMGGAMCILVGLKKPELVTGLILFAPAVGVDPNFEPFLQKIVRFLAYCCCAGCKLTKFDQTLASRNPDYPQYCEDNPEFYSGKLNARTAAAMLKGLEYVFNVSPKLSAPFILFQGGEDKVVNVRQVKRFYKKAESEDKELVFYKEMYHDIFHEPEIEEIFRKSLDWCNSRL